MINLTNAVRFNKHNSTSRPTGRKATPGIRIGTYSLAINAALAKAMGLNEEIDHIELLASGGDMYLFRSNETDGIAAKRTSNSVRKHQEHTVHARDISDRIRRGVKNAPAQGSFRVQVAEEPEMAKVLGPDGPEVACFAIITSSYVQK